MNKTLSTILICLLLIFGASDAKQVIRLPSAEAGNLISVRGGVGGVAIYDPTGDGTHTGTIYDCNFATSCSTDCYTRLNNGVRDPTVPDDGGGSSCIVMWSGGSEFVLTTDTVSGSISTVRLHVYCNEDPGSPAEPLVSVSDDGSTWEPGQSDPGCDTGNWIAKDFTGLNWSNTQIYMRFGRGLNDVHYIAAYITVNP